MAQIEKRGKSWRVRIRQFGFPQITKTFKLKELAEKWAKQTEAAMDRGAFLDQTEADRTLLGDLLSRYATEISPLKRGGKSEIIRLNAHRRHPICAQKVSSITGQQVALFRDDRLKTVSASTVLRDLNLLAHVFEVAMKEWGINLPKNPVRSVRKPKPNQSRERRLTNIEEGNLFAVLCDPSRARNGQLLPGVSRNVWLPSVCRLAIETGMRQSEIVNLRWEHINLATRTATLLMTKNGERRTVPLSTVAINTLKALPQSIDGRVFPGLTCEAVKRAFKRATRFAKIDDLHFHDLRHEATSRFFEQGFNIMEVATITGHKTMQMLRRYTHLRAEDLAKKLG